MKGDAHTTSMHTTPDPVGGMRRSFSRCSCGWEQPDEGTFAEAMEAADRHREEAAQIDSSEAKR